MVDWAQKMLLQCHLLPSDVQITCQCLLENKIFIEELIVIKTKANIVLGLLKTQGFNNNIHQTILAHLLASDTINREKNNAFLPVNNPLCRKCGTYSSKNSK